MLVIGWPSSIGQPVIHIYVTIINAVKMIIVSNMMYRFNAILTQISMIFFTKLEKQKQF